MGYGWMRQECPSGCDCRRCTDDRVYRGGNEAELREACERDQDARRDALQAMHDLCVWWFCHGLTDPKNELICGLHEGCFPDYGEDACG